MKWGVAEIIRKHIAKFMERSIYVVGPYAVNSVYDVSLERSYGILG